MNDGTDNQREEISPFVLYRTCDEQLECAVWKLDEGQEALALFISQETADAYSNAQGRSDPRGYS